MLQGIWENTKTEDPRDFNWDVLMFAACICVFLAWRLQNQIAQQELREAAEADEALNRLKPAANESDTDGSDGDEAVDEEGSPKG